MSKKKVTEGFDLGLEIDRLFSDVRADFIKFCMQNESERHIEMIRASNEPYMYTVQPKREYIENGEICEKGFKVYFKVNTKEDYEKLKAIVFDKFSKELFISPKITSPNGCGYYSGLIKFSKLKKKD